MIGAIIGDIAGSIYEFDNYRAKDFEFFEDAIRNAVSIGGDSDTVAAIAGGVAEALYGVPEEFRQAGLGKLTEEMREVVGRLYRVCPLTEVRRTVWRHGLLLALV